MWPLVPAQCDDPADAGKQEQEIKHYEGLPGTDRQKFEIALQDFESGKIENYFIPYNLYWAAGGADPARYRQWWDALFRRLGYYPQDPIFRKLGELMLRPLERDAILLADPAPARFTAEYLTDMEGLRSDVVVVAAGGLQDGQYRNTLRRKYPGRVNVPTDEEMQQVMTDYFTAEARHSTTANDPVSGEHKSIFDIYVEAFWSQNTNRPIYTLELVSYPFLAPHLEPRGLLMKVHPQALAQLPGEAIVEDRRFWDARETELMEDAGFVDNLYARSAFAQCRRKIALLYRRRDLPAEAEYAYEQAIRLGGLAMDRAEFADFLVHVGRREEAITLLREYLAGLPGNISAESFPVLFKLGLGDTREFTAKYLDVLEAMPPAGE